MSFVSLVFLVFFPLVFVGYCLVPTRYRWVLMLLISYGFYAYWDWRYIPLLFFSSLIDYFCALKMGQKECTSARKKYLLISLFVNLGILFCFKYWNFFGSNASSLFSLDLELHDLLLPLGLSFYTLQTLSYTFDVYLGKIKPEKHLGFFCLFVCFFPQLVAGPIERSRTLLPQLKSLSLPTLYQFRYGLLLIVWGLFVKLVIADNLSESINSVYFSEVRFSVWVYWLTGALVTLKIYCDFMAYSEIARGVALLFGVRLTINFRRPLFSSNLRSFWQRWHISLTRWIGDYIQIPLLRRFPTEPLRSVVTVFTLIIIGLWHGASWNFILFGLFHGVVMICWFPISKIVTQSFGFCLNYSGFYSRICLAIVLMFSAPMFYIQDTPILLSVLGYMVVPSYCTEFSDVYAVHGKLMLFKAFVGLGCLFVYSFHIECKQLDIIAEIANLVSYLRWGAAMLMLICIFMIGGFIDEPFIYFQF
ncbi:MBOAT family O-acyltransferase [Shewanella sp. YLB-07]|uniref:MBOAT family O-acyltransferase n=1 Tax=Shewanella sp. YLB-07 TaxID=2601268 RepID=UPI00128E1209|nr:MBOAT family O-acyltransferase [Shewanella sp. YLB-07]MPY24852.1 MBOAT family protein [Shewanella sp. YLB-07]